MAHGAKITDILCRADEQGKQEGAGGFKAKCYVNWHGSC